MCSVVIDRSSWRMVLSRSGALLSAVLRRLLGSEVVCGDNDLIAAVLEGAYDAISSNVRGELWLGNSWCGHGSVSDWVGWIGRVCGRRAHNGCGRMPAREMEDVAQRLPLGRISYCLKEQSSFCAGSSSQNHSGNQNLSIVDATPPTPPTGPPLRDVCHLKLLPQPSTSRPHPLASNSNPRQPSNDIQTPETSLSPGDMTQKPDSPTPTAAALIQCDTPRLSLVARQKIRYMACDLYPPPPRIERAGLRNAEAVFAVGWGVFDNMPVWDGNWRFC